MGITKTEAYDILELPYGADIDSVRTSYKRLALKWHPNKHNNSHDSTKKFQNISVAYKLLSDPEIESDDEVDMATTDMFQLFQHVFFGSSSDGPYNSYYDSDEDYEDDDEDDDELDYFVSSCSHRSRSTGQNLTPEQIERNATELITEEEKEKKRAEKRRAKKKRQREKKKLEKEQQKKEDEQSKKASVKQNGEVKSDSKKAKKDKKTKDSSASEEEEFDHSAAFFTQVVNKKKKAGVIPDSVATSKAKSKERSAANKDEDGPQVLDPIVLRSRQLAIRGNQMANSGYYKEAIDLFTEAIKLDPKDFRFFGNRSYCYDRMQQYDRALRDAEKAISLAPDWPKGYFRKGRALAGLTLYAEAETAFTQVLKLDRNCEDAMQELLRVRTHQLTEMGFSRQQAESAIQQYESVQQALDSLLAGYAAESSLAGEVYMSEDDEPAHNTPSNPTPQPVTMTTHHQPQHHHPHQKTSDVKMDPTNPEGLTALWVGNVLPEVNEKKLTAMFSKYGGVTSVRCLPDKFCAFINYKTKEAAGKAMGALQGVECAGQRLLIKFPDNPIVNGSVVIRKNGTHKSPSAPDIQLPVQIEPKKIEVGGQKVTGPVNGDECYFWRTTGCIYGKSCRYKHLPPSKGIDRKPWQKASGN